MKSVKAKDLKVGDLINARVGYDVEWIKVYSIEKENDLIIVNREFRINKNFLVNVKETSTTIEAKRNIPVYLIGLLLSAICASLIGYAVGSHSSPPRIDVYVDETEQVVCYYTAASMQCLPLMSEDE